MQNLLDLNLPWTESPFFRQFLDKRCRSDVEREQATFFHENGYLFLRGAIPDELTERIIIEISPLLGSSDQVGFRVQDAWKTSKSVKTLTGMPEILETLRFLYGREPIPFQTLNFMYGSQQRAHSDYIHFNSLPPRFMCGVWAALEDVTTENGPLFYYSGSHKLPQYTCYDMGLSVQNPDYGKYEDFIERLVDVRSYKKEHLFARKGDVLIWSSNLVHGGEKIRKPGTTRWSQVTHYFFENCVHLTPLYSNFLTGELAAEPIFNILTGRVVHPNYNGKPLSLLPARGGLNRLSERWLRTGKAIALGQRMTRAFKRKLGLSDVKPYYK